MRCPYCSDEGSRVIDSRLAREGDEIRRRRECVECGRRFTTRERVDEVLPKVFKRDERREEYQRGKLLAAIEKACAKRSVSTDAIERLVDLSRTDSEVDLTVWPENAVNVALPMNAELVRAATEDLGPGHLLLGTPRVEGAARPRLYIFTYFHVPFRLTGTF